MNRNLEYYDTLQERYAKLSATAKSFTVSQIRSWKDGVQEQQRQELESAAGFSRVFEMISRAAKPVAIHNGMLDLAYMAENFVTPLPDAWSDFKDCISSMFPGGIADTKYVVQSEFSSLEARAKRRQLQQERNREAEEEGGAPKRARTVPQAPKVPSKLLARDLVPDGWEACASMGRCLHGLVPCKVPLGARWLREMDDATRFTPADAVDMAYETCGKRVAMVVDLTFSSKYYDPVEWTRLGVRHLKIRCRGRGEAPDAEAINTFVFEAF
eukprot:jgi/Pico_ML_1/51908/g370.t2